MSSARRTPSRHQPIPSPQRHRQRVGRSKTRRSNHPRRRMHRRTRQPSVLRLDDTFGDVKAVEKEIRRNFVMGGHKALYLLKALQNHQIILVSSMPDFYATSIFKLKTARAVNDALNEAFKTGGFSRTCLGDATGQLHFTSL